MTQSLTELRYAIRYRPGLSGGGGRGSRDHRIRLSYTYMLVNNTNTVVKRWADDGSEDARHDIRQPDDKNTNVRTYARAVNLGEMKRVIERKKKSIRKIRISFLASVRNENSTIRKYYNLS